MKKFGMFTIHLFVFIQLQSPAGAESVESENNYLRSAQMNFVDGNLSELIAIIDAGLKEFPQSYNLWLMKSIYHSRLYQKEKAMAAMQASVNIAPTKVSYLRLGWIYSKVFEDYKTALSYYKKGEEVIAKANLYFYYDMAACYDLLNENNLASTYYQKYKEIETA
jgi:tetratricopeptide (TPR) repeat protein